LLRVDCLTFNAEAAREKLIVSAVATAKRNWRISMVKLVPLSPIACLS
jgi:hypothetical protein